MYQHESKFFRRGADADPDGDRDPRPSRTTTPAQVLLALLETEPRTDNTDRHERHTEYDAVADRRSQCNIKTILENTHNGID